MRTWSRSRWTGSVLNAGDGQARGILWMSPSYWETKSLFRVLRCMYEWYSWVPYAPSGMHGCMAAALSLDSCLAPHIRFEVSDHVTA